MMNSFAELEHSGAGIGPDQIALGLASFFTVSLGGLSIGIVVGFLTALITKTTSEVRVVEPLAIFGMAYMSYVTAELFHWSGIISLIGCGLVQAHYAFKNISKKSYITVKYFIKMLSATSDCVIFLYLGIALVDGYHYWHTGFVVWTLSFTLICRFIGVYGLTFIANRRRIRKVNLQEQFIMAYGGLRGAVGFSLVIMIDASVVPPKQMFVTTTLAVVMFTIFFQGGTIKFLVNLLDIDKKKESEQRMISEEVNDTVIEHTMAGIEIISGKRGSQYFGRALERFDDKYLMKWFCKHERDNDLTKLFEELAISDHLCNLYGPQVLIDPADDDVGDTDDDSHGAGLDLEDEDTVGLLSRESSLILHRQQQQRRLSYSLSVTSPSEDASSQHQPPPLPPRPTDGLQPPPRLSRARSPSFMHAFNLNRGHHSEGGEPHLRRTSSTRPRGHHHSEPGVIEPEQPSLTGLRQRKNTVREDKDAFKAGLRSNPYNRLHQKYNPNLIGDDDQELESHLRKRHATARRLSHMALVSTAKSPTGEAPTPIDGDEAMLRVPASERTGVGIILQRQRSISTVHRPNAGTRTVRFHDSPVGRKDSSASTVSSGSMRRRELDQAQSNADNPLARSSSVPLRTASKRKRSKQQRHLAQVIEEDNNGNQGTSV